MPRPPISNPTDEPAPLGLPRLLRRPGLAAAGLLLASVLVLFGGLLIAPGGRIVSRDGADLSLFFIFWREFGFSELSRGNLALWNPYTYSGEPYFGSFQAALLYPPNAIYLVFPLARAINLDVAAHLTLFGLFTLAWARWRGMNWPGAALSGMIAMFSSGYYLHIFAGHLTLTAAAAWTPLILLCAEALATAPAAGWILAGAFAIAMQILAGHPQTVYITALAAGLQLAVTAAAAGRPGLRGLARAAAPLVAIYAAGAILAAVQLGAGGAAGAESTRGGAGFSREEAAQFSLPLENFLTLIIPSFFGTAHPVNLGAGYWGRNLAWEATFYVGAAGLVLALLGATRGDPRQRRSCAAMAAILALVAAGGHTPLFDLLYAALPGFNRFRGSAKFILPASLYLALLAGAGWECLLRRPRVPRAMTAALAAAAGLLLLAGLAGWIDAGRGAEFWRRLIRFEAGTGESFSAGTIASNPRLATLAGKASARGLLMASAAIGSLAIIFLVTGRHPRAAWLAGALAALEVFIFAAVSRPTLDLERAMGGADLAGLPAASGAGGPRWIDGSPRANQLLAARAPNLLGYDPQIPRRYSEFIRFTQGLDSPAGPMQTLTLQRTHPLHRLLRLGGVVLREGGPARIMPIDGALPRASLLGRWRLAPDRQGVLAALGDPAFDPLGEAVLERRPDPEPEPAGTEGRVSVTDIDTDTLMIEAELPAPALLLLTDSHSAGWRARGMGPSPPQGRYEIMPADWTLRAIPLAAGRHRILMEYSPAGYRAGLAISTAGWLAFLPACLAAFLRRRRQTQCRRGHDSGMGFERGPDKVRPHAEITSERHTDSE